MNMDNYWFNAIYSLAPTVLVGLIFLVIMRSIIKADSQERKVKKRIEEEERARLAARLGTETSESEK
jgi:flagellar biosynthesis/type III secretory pathway M-ring protein FliF/YscJ